MACLHLHSQQFPHIKDLISGDTLWKKFITQTVRDISNDTQKTILENVK